MTSAHLTYGRTKFSKELFLKRNILPADSFPSFTYFTYLSSFSAMVSVNESPAYSIPFSSTSY